MPSSAVLLSAGSKARHTQATIQPEQCPAPVQPLRSLQLHALAAIVSLSAKYRTRREQSFRNDSFVLPQKSPFRTVDILTWYPGMTELTLEGLRVDCCYPDVQAVICGLQLHRRLGRHKHHACKAISVMTCCENLTMSLKHCNTCNSRRIQEV